MTSNSSGPLPKLFEIVPSASITTGNSDTFMFHRFLSSLARFKSLYLFSFSLIFTRWVIHRDSKVHYSAGTPFFFIIPRSGLLVGIWWSVCISKFKKIYCLILKDGFWFVLITFGSIVKFQFHSGSPSLHRRV